MTAAHLAVKLVAARADCLALWTAGMWDCSMAAQRGGGTAVPSEERKAERTVGKKAACWERKLVERSAALKAAQKVCGWAAHLAVLTVAHWVERWAVETVGPWAAEKAVCSAVKWAISSADLWAMTAAARWAESWDG